MPRINRMIQPTVKLRRSSRAVFKRNAQFPHPASEGVWIGSKEQGSPSGAAYFAIGDLKRLADMPRNGLVKSKQAVAPLERHTRIVSLFRTIEMFERQPPIFFLASFADKLALDQV